MWIINSFQYDGRKSLQLSGVTFTSLQAAQSTLNKIAAQEETDFISYRVKSSQNYLENCWYSVRLHTALRKPNWVVYDRGFIPNKVDTPFLVKNNLEPYD